jgi:hypothetical protein
MILLFTFLAGLFLPANIVLLMRYNAQSSVVEQAKKNFSDFFTSPKAEFIEPTYEQIARYEQQPEEPNKYSAV